MLGRIASDGDATRRLFSGERTAVRRPARKIMRLSRLSDCAGRCISSVLSIAVSPRWLNSPTLNSAYDLSSEIESIVKGLLNANSAWHNMLRVLPVDDIVVVDDGGAVCHVGENVAVLTGFSADELIHQPVNEVLTPWSDCAVSSWGVAGPEYPAAFPSLTLVPLALITRAGSPAQVEGVGFAITLGGRRWSFVLIARLGSNSPESREISDTRHELIASQMTGAAVLAESEERFRHSFGDNMTPTMMTDIDDRIIAVNDAFAP